MHRVLSVATAMLISLLILVPAVAAAEPSPRDEHVLVNTGGDMTLPAGQRVDLLVVVNGTATVQGEAGSVVVVNGAVNVLGGTTGDIVAIRGRVALDAAARVSGDVRTFDSTLERASGAVIDGSVGDLGSVVADAAFVVGVIGVIAYLSFVFLSLVAGLALAGIASRQVRQTTAIISSEPLKAIGASLLGLLAIISAGVIAIVTIIGIPLGLAIFALVLPLLLVVGYLVAGIWLGDQILDRTSPGVVRERPYLASLIGLLILGLVGWIPGVGAIVFLIGFGALSLQIWRVLRGSPSEAAVASRPMAVAPGS